MRIRNSTYNRHAPSVIGEDILIGSILLRVTNGIFSSGKYFRNYEIWFLGNDNLKDIFGYFSFEELRYKKELRKSVYDLLKRKEVRLSSFEEFEEGLMKKFREIEVFSAVKSQL